MTSPFDYNQQLYAYLQAWRQILEPLAAMAPPMLYPSMPPTMPAMPPATPGSTPATGDYSDRLFGYLQAWRRHLEQTTATASTTPEPAYRAAPVDTDGEDGWSPHRQPLHPPGGEHRPRNPGETDATAVPPPGDTADYLGKSGSTGPTSAATVALQPITPGGSMVPPGDFSAAMNASPYPVSPSLYGQAAVRARGRQVVVPPASEFGSRVHASPRVDSGTSSVAAERVRAAQTAKRLAAPAPPVIPADSRFTGLAERAQRHQ